MAKARPGETQCARGLTSNRPRIHSQGNSGRKQPRRAGSPKKGRHPAAWPHQEKAAVEGCLLEHTGRHKGASLLRLDREFLSQKGRAPTNPRVLPSVRPGSWRMSFACLFFLFLIVFQRCLNFPKLVLPISKRN